MEKDCQLYLFHGISPIQHYSLQHRLLVYEQNTNYQHLRVLQ